MLNELAFAFVSRICSQTSSEETIKINALVTEHVLLEGSHVEYFEELGVVDVEVVPGSREVLTHEIIELLTLDLHFFANDILGQGHGLLLVDHEDAGWLALVGLLLESEVFNDGFHELVWRFLVKLLWKSSNILDTVWGHALVAGGVVSLITISLIVSELNILAVLFIALAVGGAIGLGLLLSRSLNELIIALVIPGVSVALILHHEDGAEWRVSNNKLTISVVVLHEFVRCVLELDKAEED